MRLWVKLWVDLLADVDFNRLSPDARLTFVLSLTFAGRCDRGGLLASRTGPVTLAEFSRATGLQNDRQKRALIELKNAGFLSFDKDGYKVANWSRYQAPVDETAANRARRYRASRNRHGVTHRDVHERDGHANVTNDIEVEVEVDNGKAVLSAPPLPRNITKTIPEDPVALRDLAASFLVAFGRCSDPVKQKRHIDPYVDSLAIIRQRGLDVPAAWSAFSAAWLSHNGKPLFGSSCKSALAHLPGNGKHRVGKIATAADELLGTPGFER